MFDIALKNVIFIYQSQHHPSLPFQQKSIYMMNKSYVYEAEAEKVALLR